MDARIIITVDLSGPDLGVYSTVKFREERDVHSLHLCKVTPETANALMEMATQMARQLGTRFPIEQTP